MLKANGWRAVALTGLVVGLTYSPALGDTSVYEFLETVKIGWKVLIGKNLNDDLTGSIRIATVKDPTQYVDVSVNNGQVASAEIKTVITFFDTKQVEPTEHTGRQEATLRLQATDLDLENPGLTTDQFRSRPNQDGSMSIIDQRGSEVGRTQKKPSLFDKEQVVIRAAAHRSANALIPTRQRALPASSPVLKQVTAMVKEDVDIAMQGNISAQRKQEITYNEVRERLFELLFQVHMATGQLSDDNYDSMSVKTFKGICEANGFEYVPPDPKAKDLELRRWFTIRDPKLDDKHNVIAVGRVTPDGRSVESLPKLYVQIAEKKELLKEVVHETPEEVSAPIEVTTQELDSVMKSLSNADPTMTPPKGPDREDPNGENGGGGNLLR